MNTLSPSAVAAKPPSPVNPGIPGVLPTVEIIFVINVNFTDNVGVIVI